jgi:uncharacterized protein (DUF433 family)
MAVTVLHIDQIVSDPRVRGGRPIIAGTRLTVSDIVLIHNTGDQRTAEQIATDYRLSLGQVYAALAYYHLHEAEIDAQIAADAAEAEQLVEELGASDRLKRIDQTDG